MKTRRKRLSKTLPGSGGQAGIALVVVLWLLAVLSFLAIGFIADIRSQAHLFLNETGSSRARALADAGIHLGIRELYRKENLEEGRLPWLRDGSPYKIKLGETELSVSLHDEGGKVDINVASEDLMRGLGQALDIDTNEWDKVVDAILDWRDDDDLKRLNGAESNSYEQEGLPYGAKNGFFQSIDEVQQVLGVDHVKYRKLQHAVTIYSGRDAVSPANAPRAVLLALPGVAEQEVDALLATREANRYHVPRDVLPTLSNVSKWLHGDEGPVYTVSSVARTPRGDVFAREAVVWITKKGERRFWILDWRTAATESTGISKDGNESGE